MINIIYSISIQPGKFGYTIYNHIFKDLSLDYLYKPVKIENEHLLSDILNLVIKTEMIKGVSISMPYKQFTYDYLKNNKNFKTLSKGWNSLNTLKKINESKLLGKLTDTFILEEFYEKFLRINNEISKVFIIGKGAMSKLSYKFLYDLNYEVFLLEKYNLTKNINKINKMNNVALINATPIYLDDIIDYHSITIPTLDFPVRIDLKPENELIFDGYQATKIQFKHQYEFYTERTIDMQFIDKTCKLLFE